eukprot:scaffold303781_cov96-Cyclotella_meneghiniana.AAC.5
MEDLIDLAGLVLNLFFEFAAADHCSLNLRNGRQNQQDRCVNGRSHGCHGARLLSLPCTGQFDKKLLLIGIKKS